MKLIGKGVAPSVGRQRAGRADRVEDSGAKTTCVMVREICLEHDPGFMRGVAAGDELRRR